MSRSLRAIALEIIADMNVTTRPDSNTRTWTAPYLDAMGALDTMADHFMFDSAESIVRYFLANATGWRGDTARRIKAELKAMLPGPPRRA